MAKGSGGGGRNSGARSAAFARAGREYQRGALRGAQMTLAQERRTRGAFNVPALLRQAREARIALRTG